MLLTLEDLDKLNPTPDVITLHNTLGHETCDKCGASLWTNYPAKEVWWVCPKCPSITIEHPK